MMHTPATPNRNGNGLPAALPAGWRRARLEEVAMPRPGAWGSDEPHPGSTAMQVLGVGNVTNEGALDLSGATIRHLSPRELDAVAQEGDLLVVKSSGSAANIRSGKTAICPVRLSGKIACSNFMIRLLVDREKIEPYLLWLILNSTASKEFIRSIVAASTYPNIKWETYRSLTFPLPPPSDQRRIAARLRDQLAEVQKARAAVHAQVDAAALLSAAQLRSLFTTPAAQRWPRKPIAELCELLPSKSIALAGDAEVRAVTSACLTENSFHPAGVKTARMWAVDAHESLVRPGEILIARSNTPELVGRASIYKGDPKGVVASDLTIRLWPGPHILGEFLARYLSFLYTTGYWRERAGGASGTMKKITRSQINAEQIPLPSIAEQRAAASRLEAEFSAVSAFQNFLNARLAALDHLPAALLREAFSGKL